ncbi:hypothetical protein F4808DRAFT_432800 [Astrocystis sublimbata]|nr:hypothetical protein F4808DRAFT_432800 [Astrocystis sublimbata]
MSTQDIRKPVLGFARPAHLWMWLASGGFMALFSLYNMKSLNFDKYCGGGPHAAFPGECFYFFKHTWARIGIQVHLWCILPAGVLAGVQFVPITRRLKYVLIHRVFGFASLVLGIAGALAGLPLLRNAFGGDLAAQSGTGSAMVLFLIAQWKGYTSVRRGKIQEHRFWMLRSWFIAASVITQRVVMVIAAIIISKTGGYSMAVPCDKIEFVLGSPERTLELYPECSSYVNGTNLFRKAAADAYIFTPEVDVVQLVAAMSMTYGVAGWIALFAHVVGLEVYIQSCRYPAKKANAVKSQ